MDYGFTHEGKVYTPNGTTDIAPDASEARNAAIQAAELEAWEGRPDAMLAYFHFPAESTTLFGRPRTYRANFVPVLHSYVNKVSADDPGVADVATVKTWLGVTLGTIITAKVYTHNFGGRFVSLTVRGTNGATYHGRASWDNGQCVTLRRAK